MPNPFQKLSLFWKEIKRRNVHRSLAIYAGTAFVVLEAADMIFPRLGLPDWTVDILLYILILGAVVTIIGSWFFDVTSEGLEKTKPVGDEPEGKKKVVSSGWRIATYISLAVISGLLIYNLTGIADRTSEGDIGSLVILPFDNFTGDENLDYFVAGMHSSLIGDMGKIKGLRVISKTSANTFGGVNKSIPVIASELMVDAVMETTITCADDDICAQFKLFRTSPEEELLWSKSYDTEKQNILNLYSWVIQDIAKEIHLPLTNDQKENLQKDRKVDPDAYENYLKGKFHMEFLTRESGETAMEYFNQALDIDPDFAEAYAGIAAIWGFLKQMDYVSPDEADPEIHKYMNKALEQQVENDEIYYYDGIIKIWTDFDWEAGEESLLKCLEINPNSALARAYYSHLMMLLKRPQEMREQMKLALETDPKNPLIQVLASVETMVEMDFVTYRTRALELQKMMPNNPLLMLGLFICYTETAAYDQAIDELTKIFSQLADDQVIRTLKQTYEEQGFKLALIAAADDWTSRSETASAQHANMLYAYGGDEEKMFYWMDRMYIRRDPSAPYLGILPYLRFYNEHPRYVEILKRLNLPLGNFE